MTTWALFVEDHEQRRQACRVQQGRDVPKKKQSLEDAEPEVREAGQRFGQAIRDIGLSGIECARAVDYDQGNLSKFARGLRGMELATFLRLMRFVAQKGVDVPFVVLGHTSVGQRQAGNLEEAAKARTRAGHARRRELTKERRAKGT